jgi:hypothetical protein
MRLLFFLFISLFPFFSGKPVKDVVVVLEDISGRTQVASQTVGEKGKAAFLYLNEGSYRLTLKFPQQEGKWIREKPKYSTLTKAAFDKKKRCYYYQGREGYFAVKFRRMRKIDRETFHPVFKELRGDAEQHIVIAEFLAKRNGAQFYLQIKKLTAAQFKKTTDKVPNDISTISIRGVK